MLAADDLGDLAADDCCAVAPYKVHQLVVDLDLEELQAVVVVDRALDAGGQIVVAFSQPGDRLGPGRQEVGLRVAEDLAEGGLQDGLDLCIGLVPVDR